MTRGRRGGARRAAARPARHGDRRHDLPAGDLRRAVDPQPDQCADPRLSCWWSGPRRCSCSTGASRLISVIAIPLSLIAALLVLDLARHTINTMVLAGLVIALGDDRGRRDHRHREHRPPAAAASARGQHAVDRSRHPGRLARGRGADRLRDVDRGRWRSLPVFFLRGPVRRVLPAAGAVLRAGLARRRMVVALTVTPALCAASCFPSAARRTASLRSCAGCRRGYGVALAAIDRTAAAGVCGRRRVIALGGSWSCPRLGQELLPTFKERDFLMHWVTKPGTSLRGGGADHARPARSSRRSRGCATSARTSARRCSRTKSYGVELRRELDQRRSRRRTTTRRWRPIQECRGRLSGLFRDVQTYLKERIREVLTGSQRTDRRTHLRPRLDRAAREGAARSRRRSTKIPGIVEAHVELAGRDPADRGRGRTSRRPSGYGLKPGDVRRASAALVAGDRGRRHFPRRQGIRRAGLEHPGDPQRASTRSADFSIDTPTGGQVRLGGRGRREHRSGSERRSSASRLIAHASTSAPTCAGATSGRWSTMSSERWRRSISHADTTGAARRVRGAGGGAEPAAADSRSSPRSESCFCLQVSFGNWRLAMLAFLALPAALVGGVLAAYFGGGIISLGSLVGFLTVLGIAARNGIMLISHYPASRAQGRRSLRPRPRHPRRDASGSRRS